MSQANSYDPYAMPQDAVREPPDTLLGALRMIGPGIILAGTIVGSGELLLTTGLGATAGFTFLWLILFSCVIKVFVQIELGRYAISSGKPTLGALNALKGPRFGAHVLVWWWLLMMLATIFQLGAMTGTVGQSLNLAFPNVSIGIDEKLRGFDLGWLADRVKNGPEIPWAFVTCATAILLLWSGSYKRIELVTTAIVVTITLLTVTAACLLPFTAFPIRWNEVGRGLIGLDFKFSDTQALAAAFGVFGITGVGATELFYYPYWCLEKGYARYVGVDDGRPGWERRAKGWIRVMYLDAWVSMVVFTISTVAFYFMGACVLHPQGLDPKGKDMIQTLSRMFVDSFGDWTRVVFLVGAGAVLFKTLYLSSAANARLITDFLSLAKFVHVEQASQRAKYIHRFSLLFPIFALTLFLLFSNPKPMVIAGGFAQAATLPMIAMSALYFRYKRVDKRLAPSRAWDTVLWLAVVMITLVASYAVIQSARDFAHMLNA
ncbi:MAG: Nramp family divalent metal transporter [Pirellulaceae bacterium]|nr:Nramp family divalent metal transporter [Pirellulaceae bacterium]